MAKKYKITNQSLYILTIYDSMGIGQILKPNMYCILDILPDNRIGIIVEEIDDKGDVISIVDVTKEKKKIEETRIATLIKNQKKKKVKDEKSVSEDYLHGGI